MKISDIYNIIKLIDNSELVGKDIIISEFHKKIDILTQENNTLKDSNNEETYLSSFLEAILNKIPDPVFIKDENHNFVLLNDSICEFIGHKREELLGKSDYEFFPKEEADEYWKIDNIVLETGKEIQNEEFLTNSVTGERKTIDTKKALYVDSENNKYIVGVIRDVTEQKIAEEKLLEAITTKEKLFSIIAHDLKNPFNALLGFSVLLKNNYDTYSDEKRKSFINNIDNITKNTFNFIQNILEWTATQTGKIRYNPENISIKSVISRSMELLEDIAKNKDIQIIKTDEDVEVYADKNMLETVFRNLLSNAIKFTPKHGTIAIEISKTDSNTVKCCVADTGVGISIKNIKKIFNSKETISTSGTEGETGIGIGLTLCKEFVEINKGKIWHEPNGDKGTRLCFTIPVGKK